MHHPASDRRKQVPQMGPIRDLGHLHPGVADWLHRGAHRLPSNRGAMGDVIGRVRLPVRRHQSELPAIRWSHCHGLGLCNCPCLDSLEGPVEDKGQIVGGHRPWAGFPGVSLDLCEIAVLAVLRRL